MQVATWNWILLALQYQAPDPAMHQPHAESRVRNPSEPGPSATVGTGTTVWKGSAFQCPDNGNNILLSHRHFSSPGTMDTCNNGAIVGQSIRVANNSYISRLNVTVDASMDGQTIKCFYNNGSREIEIGLDTITIRAGIVLKYNKYSADG